MEGNRNNIQNIYTCSSHDDALSNHLLALKRRYVRNRHGTHTRRLGQPHRTNSIAKLRKQWQENARVALKSMTEGKSTQKNKKIIIPLLFPDAGVGTDRAFWVIFYRI